MHEPRQSKSAGNPKSVIFSFDLFYNTDLAMLRVCGTIIFFTVMSSIYGLACIL